MYGAILGDMVGAPFEFDRGNKTKEFPLFCDNSKITDDSVMTVAIAEALMKSDGKSDDEIKTALVKSMQKWGKRYPNAGYGAMFNRWLKEDNPKPYNSFGNGSAMRVSSAGWLYDSIEETREKAKLTAEVTHNHPEGIKGAEATASAIFLARHGKSKEEIKDYIVKEFGYNLSRTCDEIRPTYFHVETCQETVPEAITAFLEGTDFEDVIRTAVSLGGDCDTLTCIAGAIAEAFYGVPEALENECCKRTYEDMLEVIDEFNNSIGRNVKPFCNDFLDGNEAIEQAIADFHNDSSKENLECVLDSIRTRMHADGHFLFPVIVEDDEKSFRFRTVQSEDGKFWLVAFTSETEYEKGEKSQVISNFIDTTLKGCFDTDFEGFVINPWGCSFRLTKELSEMIFEADGDVKYYVPDAKITTELLKDGSFLKEAIEICNRNRTKLNILKLLRILRDSWVWIPCNANMSENDSKILEKAIEEAESGEGMESLMGKKFTVQDNIRLVPDILQNGESFFFPVFTSASEMGEYGERFSKMEKHFLEAIILAKNNEKNIDGIVINAFSEPFVINKELFELIEEWESSMDL